MIWKENYTYFIFQLNIMISQPEKKKKTPKSNGQHSLSSGFSLESLILLMFYVHHPGMLGHDILQLTISKRTV